MLLKKGPFPSPAALKQWAANNIAPMMATISGELAYGNVSGPLGACAMAGRVSAVWLSIEASGKDDDDTLSVTADVMINGTTCIDTAPVIAHVSGEASTNKTTKESGDTGITAAVLTSPGVSIGDMITYLVTPTRTASPTTEMKNLVLAVEIEPA